MKHILFVTTNSLATNPRLVKEVRACLAVGHLATVLSFSFNNWSKKLNDTLLHEFDNKVSIVLLPGDRTNTVKWLTSTCISLAARFLSKIFPQNLFLASVAFSKRSWLLHTALKRQKLQFDWIIAHNPGAFVPAFCFAKRTNTSLGIDIEDYHPGETDDLQASKVICFIMRAVLSNAQVITAASPLILEHSLLLKGEGKARVSVINNAFPSSIQPACKDLPPMPLKLIWFSQHIGLNRGIQDALEAMALVDHFDVQLTLVGNCSATVKEELLRYLKGTRHTPIFLPPVEEKELSEICSQHHVGLALETGTPLNRDLCLTNKLFVYLQAGNAVVASSTRAQRLFFKEHAGVAALYPPGNAAAFAGLLINFYETPQQLRAMRHAAYNLAVEKFNWENEAGQFISIYRLKDIKVSIS